MIRRFKRGDHVSWNSEAGRVRGRIVRVVTSEIRFKGYTVHASRDEPQYEIRSDRTDHTGISPRSPRPPNIALRSWGHKCRLWNGRLP